MKESFNKELRDLVASIWSATLGLELTEPSDSQAPPSEHTLCGCINLSGAWQGLVTVSVSEALARRVASNMFDAPADGLTMEELHDALGEIANMVGGGVKGLLPGPSQLSLPSVVSGINISLSSPGGVVVSEIKAHSSGSLVVVQVVERRKAAHVAALSA
ncbi:MAG TPA: chemotaxis protein CheX [Polyangiaceae bacterium]